MQLSLAIRLTAVVVLSSATCAWADGPKLTPGKWKFDSTIVMSMMGGEPKTQSDTKCVTKEEAEKDPLAAIVEQGRCKVLSRETSGDSLNFEIECEGDANMKMKMKGKGTFTADGSSASGKMDMTMDMPKMPNMPEMPNMPQLGNNMSMKQTWTGKRLGDCD